MRCSASSWEHHPQFFQRLQVRRQPHTRWAQAVIHRLHIHNLPDRYAWRKDPALAARDDVLSRLEVCVPREIAQYDEFSIQRPGRSDHPGVASLILDSRGDLAIRSEEHTSE